MKLNLTNEQWDVLYTSLQIVQYYSNGTQLELAEQLSQLWPQYRTFDINDHIDDVINSIHKMSEESASPIA